MVVLVILDGWGVSPKHKGNAVALAHTPVMHGLMAKCPHTLLQASGEAVGLPPGLMGNSEVGHLNLGAGRVVQQPIVKIEREIKSGEFYANRALMGAIRNVQKNDSALHLIGLVSDGRVHSSMDHIYALLELAKWNSIRRVFIHANLDGRDTPPRSARKYIRQLEQKARELEVGRIATVGGRCYGMDRDSHWERIQLAYEAYVHGRGYHAPSALQAIADAYARGESDEFMKPTVIHSDGRIADRDSVIAFNFRPERMREMTRMLTDRAFDEIREGRPPSVHYVCMTSYGSQFDLPVAFRTDAIPNVLAKVLSSRGVRQLHVAETEKYAHVTFYFNGGQETPFLGEDWRLVPSPRVASYDLKPEMSAAGVTRDVVSGVRSKHYGFVLVNFANPDMVGHTGVLAAAVKAVECVDKCVGKIVEVTERVHGVCLITADHGNCDAMLDPTTGAVKTSHTTNPVPFIIVGRPECPTPGAGTLADVAPTVLDLLGIRTPGEMTGRSLIDD
jgi:2,3-bisphosphoglycerate-independent phosphoglycerate mutase